MSSYDPHSPLPADPTPGDVTLGVLCLVSRPEYEGHEANLGLHLPCRLCGAESHALWVWCEANHALVRPGEQQKPGARRRRRTP